MSRLSLVLALIFIVVLTLRFWFYFSNIHPYKQGEMVDVVATIQSQPKMSGKVQSFSVRPEGREEVRVVVGQYPSYFYGQRVGVEGTIQKKQFGGQTMTEVFMPRIKVLPADDWTGWIFGFTNAMQSKIERLYEKTLPPKYSSLLLGITFGIKEQFPKAFLQELKASGVMHVIAASGMNVTLVAGFFLFVFTAFLKRQVAIILAIAGILFYTLLAGLEPSIVRAAIMGSVAFAAQIFGRQYKAGYFLLLAAFVMLFVNPELIFDFGFQLSFLATAGLLYINPLLLSPHLKKNFAKALLFDDIATTISAQAATIPILLSFGSYSLWAVVANALVLWTVPILMVLGGISALMGFIFEPLAQLILYTTLPLLFYFETVVSIFGVSTGIAKPVEIPVAFSLGYYLVLVSVVILVYRYRNDKATANLQFSSTKYQ